METTTELDNELPTKKRNKELEKRKLKSYNIYQDCLEAHCQEN